MLIPVLSLLLLANAPRALADSGTWTGYASGNWSDIYNWGWGAGPVADGAGNTADFSTIDLSADTAVTVDTPRTIGNLIFGDADTSSAAGWTLGGSTLTLDGSLPSITVQSLGGSKVTTVTNLLAGTAGLLKLGPGTLTLAPLAANSLSGGVTIGAGTLVVAGAQSLGQLAMPGGPVTLTNGGYLTMNGYNSSSSTGWGSFTNPVSVPSGQTGGINVFGRGTFSSAVTVAGTLNLWVSYVRGDISGNWSGSTGQINVDHASSGGDFRLNSTSSAFSLGTAAINLATGVSLYQAGNFASGGQTVTIGALSGPGSMKGGPTSGRTLTYVVGGRNTDSTFSGAVQNGTGPTAITKAGTGAWILSGVNTYTGPTLVNAGKLVGVTGGCISNTVSFTVATGATHGIQVASAGGQWVTTNATYRSGSSLEFSLGTVAPSTTVAPLLVRGNLAVSNTVTVNVLGGSGWAPGVYPLVTYPGTLGGDGFGALTLGALPLRVVGTLSNDMANSSIDLVVTAVSEPLKWAAGSSTWDIGTSANWQDATGTSTTYQEQIGIGDQVVFEDLASGAAPITVTLPATVSPVSATVNAAKDYIFSGVGSLGGSGSLTKSGSGKLTLATANSFTGGLNLNGGSLSFSSLTNLGAGAISFGGGTLQYASGTTDDISTRTVTFNAGGGTINDGGNAISFAKPVGNNGAGGLTKTGTGTLTLSGTNKYSGNTVVSQGMLVLGASAYISNSVAILVNSGATLDVTAKGLTLNNAIGQVLAGAGTVNGSVTAGTGTTLSPATNGVVGTLTVNGDLTLSGGTYAYDVSTTTRDQLVISGNLSLNAGTILSITAGSLTNGVYKVMQYSGSLLSGPGSSGNLIISGFSQPGKVAALSDTTPGEIDLVVSTQGGSQIVWQGDGTYNYWDIETSADWTKSGVASQFVQGDKVTFDDSSYNTTVNLQAAVQPGSVTVNGTQNYTFQTAVNGKITGATALTNNSTGTLTVLTANNNSGPTVINAGTVQVGNGGTTGDLGTGNIINKGVLNFAQPDDRSVAGQISGNGTLTQQGYGTLTLANDNSYSGQTTISSGALQVGTGGSAGSLGTGPVQDDAKLIMNRAGAYVLSNSISGAGALILAGNATVTLTNNLSYQNNTYISNGIVKLSRADQIPDAVSVPGSTGWLILDGGVQAGTFDLNGFNENVNALSGLGGTVVGVITNSGTTGTNILTVGNDSVGASTTWNGVIVDNPTGAKVALVKLGSGSLRMNGNNTYSGGTFVGGGTLTIGYGGTIGGGGGIVLSNGTTFNLQSAGSSSVFAGNTLTVAPGATATITSSQQGNGFNGSVVGDTTGTFVIGNANVSFASTAKQFQSFTGLVQVASGSNLRFSSTSLNINGGDFATFDVEGSLNTRNGTGNGAGVSLGALTGYGTLNGAGNSDGNTTWLIGAKNVDSTFYGAISGTSPRNSTVVKTGTARLTLEGYNTYNGNTTINQGTLALGAAGSIAASPVITVASNAVFDVSAVYGFSLAAGQSLAGSGMVTGAVYAASTSQILPGGSAAAGTLSFANGLTESGTVTNSFGLSDDPSGASRPNDLVSVTGDLNINGQNTVVINALNTGLKPGVYPLFKVSGNLLADGSPVANGAITNNLVLAGPLVTQSLAALSLSNYAGNIVLVVTAGPSLTWTGDGLSNRWDLTNSITWVQGSTPTNFYQMDSVKFDDSSVNFSATLVGTLAPSSVLVDSTNSYGFGGSGKLTGGMGLTKNGSGMLVISNTTANDYDGTVTINAGTLKAGIATALGSTNGSTVINNGGALDVGGFNLDSERVTVKGAGAGAGAIVNSGAAQSQALQFVTLAGDTTFGGPARWDIRANTNASLIGNGYKLTKVGSNDVYLVGVGETGLGNIEVQQGRLGIQDTTTLGLTGSTLTLLAGAGVDFWNSTVTNSKVVQMNNATLSSSSGTNYFAGPITLNGTETLTAGTPFTVSGAISGTGNLVKNGTSTLTLTAAESYSGSTIVSNGILALTGSASLANSPVLDVAAGRLDVSGLGGLLTLTSGQTLKGNGTVNGSVIAPLNSTVSPGEGIGTLTVTNAISLQGNLVMELNTTNAQAADKLVGASINFGGTLTLVNLGQNLAAGNSFTLFGVTTGTFAASGSFNIVPTQPGPGLVWDTSLLNSQGILAVASAPAAAAAFTLGPTSGAAPLLVTFTNTSTGGPFTSAHWDFGDGQVLDSTSTVVTHTYTVASSTNTVSLTVTNTYGAGSTYTLANAVVVTTGVVTSQPRITSIKASGGNITLIGQNSASAAGHPYSVLVTTNVAASRTNWTTLATGNFAADGGFTNTVPASDAKQFYLIAVPVP